MSESVMVIDDDEVLRRAVGHFLNNQGYRVRAAASGEEGLALCEQEMPSLVLLDLRLPGMEGMEVLRKVKELDRACRVIVLTAYDTIRSAVEALKLGAEDYIAKPLPMGELGELVARLVRQSIADQLERGMGLDRIVGESLAMHQVFERVRRISRTSSTVLITGESGTGKELIARAIHFNSDRADRPFLSVNSASIPANLLEAEMFGYEKGAFTDAKMRKRGLVEVAGGGTLLLDEIDLMPLARQAKILPVLEPRRFRRVGGTEELSAGCRFIAATNRDLEKAVKSGEFREDLYYRLNVIPIHLPPLRERGDDVLLLARHFLGEYCHRHGMSFRELSAEAETLLKAYPWSGNVRELKNEIERAVLLTDGPTIRASDLSINRRIWDRDSDKVAPVEVSGAGQVRITFPAWGLSLDDLERQVIKKALSHTRGNISQAAKLLHVSRDTLRYRMQKHRIPFPQAQQEKP